MMRALLLASTALLPTLAHAACGPIDAATNAALTTLLHAQIDPATFIASLGVNTHLSQGFGNPTAMLAELSYLGISNIRDGLDAPPSTYAPLVAAGIHIDGVTSYGASPQAQIASAIAIAALKPGALASVEGPNEININPVTYNGATTSMSGSFMPAVQYQAALYAGIHAALPGVPVLDLTSTGAEPDNVGLQSLTGLADYANIHVYPRSGTVAAGDIAQELGAQYGQTWGKGFSGYTQGQLATLPKVITEFGFPTIASGTDGQAVDPATQAINLMALILQGAQSGYSKLYLYELSDDPRLFGDEGSYGLFNADGTPKPIATAIHNLTTALQSSSACTGSSIVVQTVSPADTAPPSTLSDTAPASGYVPGYPTTPTVAKANLVAPTITVAPMYAAPPITAPVYTRNANPPLNFLSQSSWFAANPVAAAAEKAMCDAGAGTTPWTAYCAEAGSR